MEIANLRTYFASRTCYFLEPLSKDLYKVYYAYKCINIYFICNNHAPLEADGVQTLRTWQQRQLGLNCLPPLRSRPSSGKVDLTL